MFEDVFLDYMVYVFYYFYVFCVLDVSFEFAGFLDGLEMYGTFVRKDKYAIWRVFSKTLDVGYDIFYYVRPDV